MPASRFGGPAIAAGLPGTIRRGLFRIEAGAIETGWAVIERGWTGIVLAIEGTGLWRGSRESWCRIQRDEDGPSVTQIPRSVPCSILNEDADAVLCMDSLCILKSLAREYHHPS